MPRYFIDIHDGAENRDTEGVELPSLEVARAHAMQVAAAYAGKPLPIDKDGGAVSVSVRDAAGTTRLVVRLAFSVEST